jgi:hypothetical protein
MTFQSRGGALVMAISHTAHGTAEAPARSLNPCVCPEEKARLR